MVKILLKFKQKNFSNSPVIVGKLMGREGSEHSNNSSHPWREHYFSLRHACQGGMMRSSMRLFAAILFSGFAATGKRAFPCESLRMDSVSPPTRLCHSIYPLIIVDNSSRHLEEASSPHKYMVPLTRSMRT